MVERVVKAVAEFLDTTIMSTYDGSGKWCIVLKGQLLEVFPDEEVARTAFNRLHAAAAIGAMREPTSAMVKQGEASCFEWMSEEGHEWTHDAFRDGYRAAIDAALGNIYA